MKLNTSQQQAVVHQSTPLLIVAGAGTGKTTVITERIKYLIQEKGVDPQHIFAATFTQKAAEEMLSRLDQVMPLSYQEPWLGTFHSLCDQLLKRDGLEIGLNPNYTIMTATDQWLFLKEHLYNLELTYYRPLGNPNKFISALISFFSRLTDEDLNPEEFKAFAATQAKSAATDADHAEAERLTELAAAYIRYEQLKRANSVMDFGDLISFTLRLLRTRPNLRRHYQTYFKHILVDEFQDTNYAQFELIKLLAPPDSNPPLTVVADDDQCFPAHTKITTSNGVKSIKLIKKGDLVLSAAGKGYTTYASVTNVSKTTKECRLINLTTSSQTKITLTDNHKVFCHVKQHPNNRSIHYVYLMKKNNLGWRIGVTNDLVVRLRLERGADSILAIKACQTDQEARYYEALYSLKYGIPTTEFSARPGMVITDRWHKKLMGQLDSDKAVAKLAQDLNLDLTAPHLLSDGTTRGQSKRAKINVYLCSRQYSSKTHHEGFILHPQILHSYVLQTSNQEIINKLIEHKISFKKLKKGISIRKTSTNLKQIITDAEHLAAVTGAQIDEQSSIARLQSRSLMSRIIPAKNILPGMYIPRLKGRKVVYERVITVGVSHKHETVYDLEVTPTHNYCADNVIVHNSIYRFRGASVANVLEFKQVYPQAKEIVLTDNYRSTQSILNSAYQVIGHNNPNRLESILDISKKLTAVSTPKTRSTVKPRALVFPTLYDEIDWTAHEIIRLVTKENLTYQDIAVLTRSNAQLDPYVVALRQYGIPYQLIANRGLYDQDEIVGLIQLLRVIADPTDTLALFPLTQLPLFSVSPQIVFAALSSAKKSSHTLWHELKQLKDSQVQKLVDTVSTFQHQAASTSITRLLYQFVLDSGYVDQFLSEESLDNQLKIKNLNLFFNQLKHFEAVSKDKTVSAFLPTLELWLEAGDNPGQAQIEDIDTVSLMTVHAAKGLEFAAVFVGSLISGRFPSTTRRDPIEIPDALVKETVPSGDIHLQEERRLFYVALTRAKRFLYLTAAKDVGGKRERRVSGFVTETDLPLQFMDTSSTTPLTTSTKPPLVKVIEGGEYRINRVSYSQLDTFKVCPLKYKYRYLLQIPARPHHSISFGRTIHATLEQFHQLEMQGQSMSLPELLQTYKQNFIEEGYDSPAQMQERFISGQEALKRYFKTYQKILGKPVMLEQKFQLKIDSATLVGKIDRVEKEADGSFDIVDYKTGQPKDQKSVDKDEQLTIYALAAKEALKFTPKHLSLYFLEDGSMVTTSRTPNQLKTAHAKLVKEIQNLKLSDFPPKPSEFTCRYCEYNRLCPFAKLK